jgi:3-phenylpropionate/cinnamic acid dioxygenase small subunit
MRDEVRREVEQFLYREARLLDELRFREWLALFSDDARYWMPTRAVRYTADSKAISTADEPSGDDSGLAGEEELAVVEDTKRVLELRVARLESGFAWAEDPRSRTSHFVTNVEVEDGEAEDEVRVYCKFLTHRLRLENEEDFLIGRREDVLRRVDGQWKIARRKIILDQTVLTARNLSILL